MSSTLREAIFWVAVAVCLVAQVAIVRGSLWPKRAPSPNDANVLVPSRGWEVGWTLVPAVVLALLLVFTWRAMHTPVSASNIAPSAAVHSHNGS
ncbi:MAG TPA: hypothetical protein VJ596_05180 [Gemmatimonadaceae bacterium]|nr:hypothetical protein [Gemmatimonadaceae bacterium]